MGSSGILANDVINILAYLSFKNYSTLQNDLTLFQQLADAKEVMNMVKLLEGARFPVLTPNLRVSVIISCNISNADTNILSH